MAGDGKAFCMVSRNTLGGAFPGFNPEFATIFVAGPEATQADVAAAHSRSTYAVSAGQTVASLTESVLTDPRQLASAPAGRTPPGPNRAFVSGLPISLVADGGVPAWAHGLHSRAVTPPMLTADGLPTQLHWIDPIIQLTLVRSGQADVLLSLPLNLVGSGGRVFQIGAGSIWFAAGLLAPVAAGGFAGLRVTSGTLTVDADLAFGFLQFVLPAGATATLTVELEQTVAAPTSGGPGMDEELARVRVPRSLTITFSPAGASLATGGDASLTVFGVTVGLKPGTAVAYDTTTGDLTLALTPDLAEFSPSASGDAIATPIGAAPLHNAAWTIPVAFTTVENLGEASGPGALRLLLGSGISARTPALNLDFPLRSLAISVGSGILELTGALDARVDPTIRLWDTVAGTGQPRRSSILFHVEPEDTLLIREAAGTELVALSGACTTSLDRPLAADGRRLNPAFPKATLAILRTFSGTIGYIVGSSGNRTGAKPRSIVLENALLTVASAETLLAVGKLAEGRIDKGSLRLQLPLFGVFPILPDPYASNQSDRASGTVSAEVLTIEVGWTSPDSAFLRVFTKDNGQQPPIVEQDFGITLLDVSTNSDLLGVRLGPRDRAQIDASVLAASGSALGIFTVPGISWEPVEVEDPTVTVDPPPNDGDPTFLKVATVRLVPVEPAPLLREYVAAVQAGASGDMHFMLPFGLVANASLAVGAVPGRGASYELVTPVFPQLQGGLQLTVRPPDPGDATSGFDGFVDTRGPGAAQVLGPEVFKFFNDEFGSAGVGPHRKGSIVPVKRVDLSGYGNSMYSDWVNAQEIAGVAEARFDVIVGRTSYEVIQVVSVIHPYWIRVVRTVTLARQAGGRILRTDTGWQPLSDGKFDNPPGIVAHKGPVVRVLNVHNIKDQGQDIVLDPGVPGLEFETVTFDADVEISPDLAVPAGGKTTASGTVVPSFGLTGYLQHKPIGTLLTIDQVGALMQGRTAGGPVACTVDLGGPGVAGPQVRVTGIAVNAVSNAGTTELVVSLLGMPRLPSNGSWSVGQLAPSDRAPRTLDPGAAVPLIRQNGGPAWNFADPADVNQLTTPGGTQYGLLQATGTQRAFFSQPNVPAGTSQIGLGQPPHLADVASLLSATGAFPELKDALQFDQPPQITAVGDTLTVKKRQFTLAGVPPRTLFKLSPAEVLLAFDDGKTPATATVEINPAGSPAWTIDIGVVSILLILPPFGTADDPLLRLTGSIHADALSAPGYKDLVVHFGGAMSLVEEVFSRLQELAKLLPGGSASLDVSFADGRLVIRDSFTLPNLPLGLGQITDVGMDLGLTVSLTPASVDFQVGIASPDKPFHWLVSPLSGTGAVVVGSKDGRPTLLIQAGIGAGLGIDVGIASGSASVVIAFQVDNRVAPLELKVILTGQAEVDVLEGLASVALTLSAAMGIIPDKLPIPHEITLFADVAVGIHIAVCWVASVDFDGSWHVQQTLTSPIS